MVDWKAKMVDWKALNDRAERAVVLRNIVGSDLDEGTRAALEMAEGVQEAARFIRQMRTEAKLTQKALGDRLGVNQARISELERGGSPEGVSYALLRRVAIACEFSNWPAAPAKRLEPDDQLPVVTVRVVPKEQSEPLVEERTRSGRLVRGLQRPVKTEVELLHGEYSLANHVITLHVEPTPRKTGRPGYPISEEDEIRMVRNALERSPDLKVIEPA